MIGVGVWNWPQSRSGAAGGAAEELRGLWTLEIRGTPAQAPTYDTATGEGFAFKTSNPNNGGISFAADPAKSYRLVIEALAAAVAVRSAYIGGPIIESVAASTTSEIVLSGQTVYSISAVSPVTETPFIVQSFTEA